jgi:chromosome segregation ATPase
MRNTVKSGLVGVVIVGFGLLGAGCDTSGGMNRDLKRSADRATIQLDRQKAELATAKADAEAARTALEAETKRADAATRELGELRQRLSRSEADLLLSRQRVRELEEAALAARQGMPATRTVQP